MKYDEPIVDNSFLRKRSCDHRNIRDKPNISKQMSNVKDVRSEDITNFSTPKPPDCPNGQNSNRNHDTEKDEKHSVPLDNSYLKYANYTSLMLENKGSVARDHVSESEF